MDATGEYGIGRNKWGGREVTQGKPKTKDKNFPKCGLPCPALSSLAFSLPTASIHGEPQKMAGPQELKFLK